MDDSDRFWLSSGNWKNSSQPLFAPTDLNKPTKLKKGNREWHVVVKNRTLAGRYRNHILADLEFSKGNGGKEESVAADIFVDVPIAVEESIELEARAARRILEPLEIKRRVKVKPLLTPDQKGKVYSDAVLDLIKSADDQLLFQIPYINSYKDTAKGYLEKLVKALIQKSKADRRRSRVSCAPTMAPGFPAPRISRSAGSISTSASSICPAPTPKA